MTDYSTHPDYVALLATVCEDPDADLPRLVLADWLDDRGDKASAARSELVRVQCELAAKPRVSGDFVYCRSVHLTGAEADWVVTGRFGVNSATGPTPRCRCGNCRLLRRERDLSARHRIDWDREVLAVPHAAWQERFVRNAADALPAPWHRPGLTAAEVALLVTADMVARARPSPDDWLFGRDTLHYARGFVARLTLPPAALIEYGAALLGAAPIERVVVPDPDGGGGIRVEIDPPGRDDGWRAYFYRGGEPYFEVARWESRAEMATGVAAAVAVALDAGHPVTG